MIYDFRFTVRFSLILTMVVCLACCASADAAQTNAFSPADFRVVLKHASSGDSEAQMEVANCYHEGLGVEQDKAESLKWMERAAEQGKSYAQFLVGLKYYVGLDVKLDEKKGIELIERAANQGEPAALHYLSAAYYLGKGKKQDYLQAYVWELVFMDSSKIMIPDDAESLRARIVEVEQKLTPEQIKMGKAEAQKLKNRLSKLPRYSAD